MPSRTYIQMALNKHRAGKLPMNESNVRLFELYLSFIEGYPELKEKVINGRVKAVKAIKDFYYPLQNLKLPRYQMAMIELILISYYTGHKLSYVPARGIGWSEVDKLLTIMFHGNVFDVFDTSNGK